MSKTMNVILVYIDDDQKMRDDAFIDELEGSVDRIEYFDKPSEGLDFIKKNIDKNIITILDWKFNNSSLQGEKILSDIYDISELVPVIVYTGTNINASETNKMFKGHAFSCIPKDVSTEIIVEAIKDAYDRIQNDIRSVIEKWILKQDIEKRNKPYMRTGDKVYTLNDILSSIRKQDEFGKDTVRGIMALATELFTNNMREK